ncbi:MAG: acyl-CoA thioesterase [Rhodospirillales bacterium]|nr:acyl-CoA thioesterase [Rhodospirillales bacterium]
MMQDQPRLENFPLRSFDKLRYSDTDRQGHVNNTVFATFLETGRCELIDRVFGSYRLDAGSFVTARIELDFRAELFWPGEVEIGTAVKTIGNSSVRVAQAIFQDGKLAATGESVLVHLGTDKRPAPLPDAAREALTALMLPSA